MAEGTARVCWLLINASHYHVARWSAFSGDAEFRATLVELANRDAGFAALQAARYDGVEYRTLFPGRHWRTVSGAERRRAIHRELDELSPDVVCLNGWSMGGAAAGLEWCRKRGRRAIMFSDSNAFDHVRHGLREALKRRLLALVDGAVVAGRTAREYMVALGVPAARVSIGYDVVDNAHFAGGAPGSAPAAAPPPPFFIAAARFEPKKNHLGLLDAFADYRRRAGDSAWPLVILGDGFLRPQMEERITALGLEGAVTLPGFADYAALPDWYARAACFVHPSTTEQWGLVVNEAMAAGLPVLVSAQCGCAADLVHPGENGYTFDPHDTGALTERMFMLAHGGADLDAMGQASRRIIADWGPERFAAGVREAVKAALASAPQRAGPLDFVLLRALAGR